MAKKVGFINSKSRGIYLGPNKNIESVDLRGLDTSKVTDMSYMFYSVKGLKNLDVSGFDTSKVKEMDDMFERDALQ